MYVNICKKQIKIFFTALQYFFFTLSVQILIIMLIVLHTGTIILAILLVLLKCIC